MELWKLLLLLVLILGLGTFSNFLRFTRRRIAGPFTLHQSHLRHLKHEGFYGGGFDLGFNGGFGSGVGAELDSVPVTRRHLVKESFVGGGGHGGHGGGHGGHGGGHGGWHGPSGYRGPNQGTWRGWGGDSGTWGWYGWSYPWAWYAPPVVATIECISDADCDNGGKCGEAGFCIN